MKRFLACVLTTLSFALFVAAQDGRTAVREVADDAQGWQLITAPERFSAMMPTTTEILADKLPYKQWTFSGRNYIYQSEELGLFVLTLDLSQALNSPEISKNAEAKKEFLSGIFDFYEQRIREVEVNSQKPGAPNKVLVEETDPFVSGKAVGRSFMLSLAGGAIARYMVLERDARLYLVGAIAAKAFFSLTETNKATKKRFGEEVPRFFDSFAIE